MHALGVPNTIPMSRGSLEDLTGLRSSYAWLWFITVKGYKVRRGKRDAGWNPGPPGAGFHETSPSKVTEDTLIPPVTSCSDTSKGCLPEKLPGVLEPSVFPSELSRTLMGLTLSCTGGHVCESPAGLSHIKIHVLFLTAPSFHLAHCAKVRVTGVRFIQS